MDEAKKGGYSVVVIINGEYYDYQEVIKIGCTKQEWEELKHKELRGMVAELFNRIEKLEKKLGGCQNDK